MAMWQHLSAECVIWYVDKLPRTRFHFCISFASAYLISTLHVQCSARESFLHHKLFKLMQCLLKHLTLLNLHKRFWLSNMDILIGFSKHHLHCCFVILNGTHLLKFIMLTLILIFIVNMFLLLDWLISIEETQGKEHISITGNALLWLAIMCSVL